MKQKIIYIIALALFVSLGMIIADVLLTTETTIELSKEQKQALEDKGIANVKAIEYECADEYKRCFHLIGGTLNRKNWKKVDTRVCVESNRTTRKCIEYRNLTSEEILNNLDKLIKANLEKIANEEIERQKPKKDIIFGEREVIIQEKK